MKEGIDSDLIQHCIYKKYFFVDDC